MERFRVHRYSNNTVVVSYTSRNVYGVSVILGMKHVYTLLCRFVPMMKSIFRFACLTDGELREDLYEMDDMIARNLLIGRR